MNSEGLNDLQLNCLLSRFTINNVQLRRERKTEALNSWKPIVDAILGYVKERHDYFASLRIFHCGSYYERTKVGEPDEFDLMLVMENAVLHELNLPALSNPPIGGFNIRHVWLHCCASKRCERVYRIAFHFRLRPNQVLVLFFRANTIACNELFVSLSLF